MNLTILTLSMLLQVVAALLAWRLMRVGKGHEMRILSQAVLAAVGVLFVITLVRLTVPPSASASDILIGLGTLLLSLLLTLELRRASRRIEMEIPGTDESPFETGQALRTLVQASPLAIMALDPEGRVTLWNPAAERMFGWSAREALGRPLPIVPEDRQEAFRQLWKRALEGESFTGLELQRRRKDGTLVDISLSTAPLLDASGHLSGIMGAAVDITQTKVAEKAIHQLAYYDPLTGLPNRLLLQDRLGQSLVQANREGNLVGVIFLDLDHFKHVNDTLGHGAGDDLLRMAAKRLRTTVRKSDTVARLGGDEFVVLLPAVNHPEDARSISQKVLGILAEPFDLREKQVFTSASAGIGLYPADGQDVESLIRCADLAMYRAKQEGRNTCRFFSREMNRRAEEALALEDDLHRALEGEEFILYFQPQVELESGRISGAEVLLRWRHPQWGLMAPESFIPPAEETGLIIPVGLWVLRQACLQARQWQEQGLAVMRLAIHLSPRQIRQKDLPEAVEEILRETGLDPALLELEISEEAVRNHEESVAILQQLRQLGLGFALDRFGTGLCPIALLNRMPLARLKIDLSFIRRLPDDRESAAATRLIIAMARSLKVAVLAEGVETEAQRAFLLANRCGQGQGLLFGPPLPAGEFSRLLKPGRPAGKTPGEA